MATLISTLSAPALALLLQLVAWSGVSLISARLSYPLSAPLFSLCCGLLAAGLSYAARLPLWWLIIQFAFVPAVVATRALAIPPGYFLALFLLLGLVYWNIFNTRVPLYLSSAKVRQTLTHLLPPPAPGRRFRFADIGSGLGGVLTYLARIRTDGDYYGVESAPLPFIWSWLRIRTGGYRQCRVRWGDFWDCNLADFDVVYAYLSPVPMAKLWRKAQAEMKPGAVFISSTFSVPGQTPTEIIQIDDLHHSTLMIWRM